MVHPDTARPTASEHAVERHWTYAADLTPDLEQGDILLPNPGLKAALSQAHPWFTNPKYIGFMVISQTCDLVRRDGGRCKTPFVEIAAIRSFQGYLRRLMHKQFQSVAGDCFPASDDGRALDLMDRIINQNESANGIFYLHPEERVQISEHAIVLLRVTVALKAELHYETLLSARTGRLEREFADKMGWLCGNLYARVGVRDWKENSQSRSRAEEIKRALLSHPTEGVEFMNFPKRMLDDIKEGKLDVSKLSREKIKEVAAGYRGVPVRERLIEVLRRLMSDNSVPQAHVDAVMKDVRSDRELGTLLKKDV